MSARILLAAGGTGGHMFPAEALALVLLDRGLSVDLVTDSRGQGFGGRLPQVSQHRIASGGIAGKGIADRAKNALRLAGGVFQSRGLIRRLAPAVAVGFGGYPSLPPILAAQWRGVPTVIHEQNAVAGRANRALAGRARRVATGFAKVRGFEKVSADRLAVTGNPVRPEIASIAAYRAPQVNDPIELLVFGGSQGARLFGRIVPAAIAKLPAGLLARLRLAQQCRPEDMDAVSEAYRTLGLAVDLAPFFADMPRRLERAHLVLCRAGASSVAELAAAGRPSLLVPLANAIDDHQAANALALSEPGAAWILREDAFTPERLAESLTAILGDSEALGRAAGIAHGLARRDAAERLADAVTALVPAMGRAA